MKAKQVRLTGRRALLAAIHCAKKELRLDDPTYRALLERLANGKASASELTDHELGRVVDHMRRLGWTSKSRTKASRDPHVRKLWAVWNELCASGVIRNPTREALRAWVKRMTGVDDPEWLDPAQVNRMIEAMKKWAERVASSTGSADLEEEG